MGQHFTVFTHNYGVLFPQGGPCHSPCTELWCTVPPRGSMSQSLYRTVVYCSPKGVHVTVLVQNCGVLFPQGGPRHSPCTELWCTVPPRGSTSQSLYRSMVYCCSKGICNTLQISYRSIVYCCSKRICNTSKISYRIIVYCCPKGIYNTLQFSYRIIVYCSPKGITLYNFHTELQCPVPPSV